MSVSKDRPPGTRIKVNADDVMKKQILDEETEYYDDESNDEKRMTSLMQLKQRDLPCPQEYRELFEHPSTREFIGFDISGWISRSTAIKTANEQLKLISFLALMSHLACTFVAFLR